MQDQCRRCGMKIVIKLSSLFYKNHPFMVHYTYATKYSHNADKVSLKSLKYLHSSPC